MERIEWENVWLGLLFVIACGLIVVIGMAIFADHKPRSYYLAGSIGSATCIVAENPWDADNVVSCFVDFTQAVDAARKANELLKVK